MIPKILISPDLEARVGEIEKILASHPGGVGINHPDMLYFPADAKLGIEQARKIKEHLSFKPLQAKGKGVVIEDAKELTLEAQNALLKILEEPPTEAVIILGANSDATFLPTLLSRCEVVRVQAHGSEEPQARRGIGYRVQEENYTKEIWKLLEADIEERFVYIEKLKDKEEFLYALTSYFHQQLLETDSHKRGRLVRLNEFLEELLEAEKWAKQNVNIRAILEYLMLIMPQK